MQHKLWLVSFNPGVRVLQTGEQHHGLIGNSINIRNIKIIPAAEL